MALSAPTNLSATTISSSRIRLTWINTDSYQNIQVWQLKATLDFDDGSVEPQVDEILTGATSGKTAKVVSVHKTAGTWGGGDAEGYIHLKDCDGAFQNDEAIDGSVGGNDILTVNEPTAPPGSWAQVGNVPGAKEYFIKPALDPSTKYYYKLKGETYEPPDTSDFSGEAYAITYGELQDPTNLIATPFSDTEIEVTFKDNSQTEDDHRLERKEGAGAYSEIATIPANMDYYRDSGLTKGNTYTYKVRAKEGASYSDYSNEDSATTISEPSAPSSLALSEITDKSMFLSWTGVANETGYRIEKSDTGVFGGEEEEIAVIGADLTEFLVTGLDPSTQYWFRIRAYNAGGNSTYSNTATDTTLAQYVKTDFEKFIRNPNIDPVYLAEVNPKMTLTSFSLTGGQTYTYEKTIEERGIDIEKTFEDGRTEYTEKASIAEVEANASSFWFDYDNRKLYVHTSDGTNPSNFFMECSFWLYISTHKNIIFNGNFYLPFLNKEDIPSITQEIKPYFEGSFSISSGSISFVNGKIGGEHFFDKRFGKYTWINSKLILKAGKEGFTYAKFKEVFTGYIDDKGCNDRKITFQLRDVRKEMERDLILARYSTNDFPDMDEEFIDEPIPKNFGFIENSVSVCIDRINDKFNFNDGRSKSVAKVEKNDTVLTEDTHYFVDLQRSIITFERDSFELNEEDIVKISFMGFVNSADEAIENGAEVFKHIMNNYYGLENPRLNHDSIYESKYANEKGLAVPLYKDTPFDEIIRNIEHSIEAFTFQDEKGRLGIRPKQTTVPSSVKYIENHRLFSHSQEKDKKSLFWKVNVYYNENPQTEDWEVKTATKDEIYWQYGVTEELDVYVYLPSPSHAQDLADSILILLNKETVNDTLDMLIFDELPGNLIKFSRNRFYNASGTANEITMRIIKISKSPASGKTSINMEIVE